VVTHDNIFVQGYTAVKVTHIEIESKIIMSITKHVIHKHIIQNQKVFGYAMLIRSTNPKVDFLCKLVPARNIKLTVIIGRSDEMYF